MLAAIFWSSMFSDDPSPGVAATSCQTCGCTLWHKMATNKRSHWDSGQLQLSAKDHRALGEPKHTLHCKSLLGCRCVSILQVKIVTIILLKGGKMRNFRNNLPKGIYHTKASVRAIVLCTHAFVCVCLYWNICLLVFLSLQFAAQIIQISQPLPVNLLGIMYSRAMKKRFGLLTLVVFFLLLSYSVITACPCLSSYFTLHLL